MNDAEKNARKAALKEMKGMIDDWFVKEMEGAGSAPEVSVSVSKPKEGEGACEDCGKEPCECEDDEHEMEEEGEPESPRKKMSLKELMDLK